MDALKKSFMAFAVIAIMLCVIPNSLDADASDETDGLLLYQVNPYGDDEGISIRNYGNSTIDLKDYQIQTRNYTLSFNKSIDITADSSATFYRADVEGSYFATQTDSYRFADSCTITDGAKDFSKITNLLINGGDYIQLKDDKGNVIDAVYYGSKTETDKTYWTGEPLTISSKTTVQRVNGYDSNSSIDWVKYIIGGTNLEFDPELKFDAKVTPFLFPESGGIPVLKALESATEYIYIEIYMLANENVYSLLLDKLNSGVEVKILVEGESVNSGVELKPNLPYMKALIDGGASINLIGVGDDGVKDRFNYVHAKFAVIDDKKVIVTSENWTQKNLNGSITENPYKGDNGNRGWGAIMEGTQYAAYMKAVFENDFRTDYKDVKEFKTVYPRVTAAALGPYKAPMDASFPSYSAKVTPILSCDNSLKAADYYISNAKNRVYSEQQSFQEYYTDLSIQSPFSAMANKASKDNVDCRLILSDKCSSDLVLELNQTSLVKTARMTGTYVHNKGLICDDTVWVSSINWTDNSFKNNRESCVAIHSSEVADYFAESFLQDFAKFYTYDGFSVDITEIKSSYPAGKEITFSVTVNPSTGNYRYTWDIGDGSEPIVTTVPRIVCKPVNDGDATAYVLKVTVEDLDTHKTATVSKGYSVEKEGSSSEIVETLEENKIALIPIILAILGAIIALFKSSSKKKKRKSTNTKKRK